MTFDFNRLLYAVKDVLREEDYAKYDFDTIIRSATLVWDDTAIEVKSSDFVMVFDKISYELLNYTGFDLK